MSYGINPYAVNVDTLIAKHGCKDGKFQLSIEQKFAAQLKRDEKQLARDRAHNPSRPALRDALRRFIGGDTRHPTEGEQLWYGPYYGYAMEMICRVLGRRLVNSEFEDIRSSFLDKLGIMRTLLHSPPPVPLTDPKDFPAVHHLAADEVLHEHRRLEPWNDWSRDPFVRRAEEQYRGWIAEAAAEGQGIVVFYR
jgi:hypothetical protein